MPNLRIILDGDGAFEDWKNEPILAHITGEHEVRVVALARGMTSGRASVTIGVNTGRGVIYIETSMRLFQAAAAAFIGRYGEE